MNFLIYFQVITHYFLGTPEEKHISFRITVLPNTRHDSWFEEDADHLKKKKEDILQKITIKDSSTVFFT